MHQRNHSALLGVAVISGAAALLATTVPPSAAGTPWPRIVRVSVGDDERQSRFGERFPERPSISRSGRYVTFVSLSPDLVAGDTNAGPDVFVRDRLAGSTRRVSLGTGGQQVSAAGEATISANGRRVVFTTADPLVRGDTNDTVDVYVRDRWTARTSLVSARPDGRAGDGPSFLAHTAGGGRYVVFQSSASNLVAGDTNRVEDAFLRDLVTGRTERVSVLPTGHGGQAAGFEPRVSPDGVRVLFGSLNADDSVEVWVRNRRAGITVRVRTGLPRRAAIGSLSMSANGRYVAFTTDAGLVAGDTNGENDVYRIDRWSGQRVRISVGSAGQQGNSYSETVELAADGRVAAFSSQASNLVPADTNGVIDVFRRDIAAGTTRRISVSAAGVQGNGDSSFSRDLAISADGRHVAFASFASNLAPGDTNGDPDVFAWDRTPPK